MRDEAISPQSASPRDLLLDYSGQPLCRADGVKYRCRAAGERDGGGQGQAGREGAGCLGQNGEDPLGSP
jgi:hypothetical protein